MYDFSTVQAPTASGDDPTTIRAALLRMTPEERATMMEPFQEELNTYGQQSQGQHHSTGLGGAFGALAQGIGGYKHGKTMSKMQQDANARLRARYNLDSAPSDVDRQAMVAMLRNQNPFQLPDLTLGE